MKNPIVLITSCGRDKERGYHDAIRQTWGKNSPVPYRFLLGQGNTAEPDEVVFDTPDDHAHVTSKTKLGHAWACEHGYGHALQVFSDTYVNFKPMLESDFASHHYVGLFRGTSPETDNSKPDRQGRYNYASGGPGYWVSPEGSAALGAAEIEDVSLLWWAEDLWAGTALGRAGFYGHNDERYRLEATWYLDYVRAGRISTRLIFGLHLGRGTGIYDPQWMLDAHAIMSM